MATAIFVLIILCGVIAFVLVGKKGKSASSAGNSLLSEVKQSAEQRKLENTETSELAQKQEQRSYWLLLHVLLSLYHEFQSNTNNLKQASHQLEELDKTLAELKTIYDPQKHDAMVKKAIKEFVENGNDKPDKELRGFIAKPLDVDVSKLRYAKYAEIVKGYEPYWESAIATLKQKAAIRKRRQYLIDQIAEMITECDKYGYTDLTAILTDYQKKQEDLLAMP